MGFSSSEATFHHVLGSKESPKDGLIQHIFPTSRLRVRPHLMVGRSSGSWSGGAKYHLHTHRCGDMCEHASSRAGTGSTRDTVEAGRADEWMRTDRRSLASL